MGFLGWCVAVVKVQVMHISLVTDAQDALLEHALQTAIPTLCAIVMVDRMIADFFFSGRYRWANAPTDSPYAGGTG